MIVECAGFENNSGAIELFENALKPLEIIHKPTQAQDPSSFVLGVRHDLGGAGGGSTSQF